MIAAERVDGTRLGRHSEARQGARFELVAADVDQDTLAYSWSVGGESREGEGGALEVQKLTEDVTVAVRVDDGKGGVLEESWEVDVNRAPSLAIAPRSLERFVGHAEELARDRDVFVLTVAGVPM